ncbi:unnamed protein product, partial [Meganyctiphanes norvegica]
MVGNMNTAVSLIGLCALSTNAHHFLHLIPYSLPYTPNLLHSVNFPPFTYTSHNVQTFVSDPKTTPSIHTVVTNTTAPVTHVVTVPVVPHVTLPAVPPVASPVTPTLYHAQGEQGQYNFGHYGGPSSHNQARDAFGVVRGQYNYIDSDGKLQQSNYISDAGGFRVSATNLPVAPEEPIPFYLNPPRPVEDTAEVAAAKAEHMRKLDAAIAAATAKPEPPNLNTTKSVDVAPAQP